MDSLQLPVNNPQELLTECAAELDAMWRHLATHAVDGDITVDADGRVHAVRSRRSPSRRV